VSTKTMPPYGKGLTMEQYKYYTVSWVEKGLPSSALFSSKEVREMQILVSQKKTISPVEVKVFSSIANENRL